MHDSPDDEPTGRPLDPITPEAGTPAAVPASGSGLSGWRPPGETPATDRRFGCVVAVLALVAVLAVTSFSAIVALIFLGSQVSKILAGTVEVGTGGSGCAVEGRGTSFPASSPLHIVAHLERTVEAGETVTVIVTVPGSSPVADDQTFTDSGACIVEDLPADALAPGHYVLEYRVGTDSMAKGEFDITP